jgi:hypothetical protein
VSGWRAPDAGLVDRLGYMYCTPCAEALDKTGEPVAGDQHFGADDKCEKCGKQFEHVSTRDYVRVGGPGTY